MSPGHHAEKNKARFQASEYLEDFLKHSMMQAFGSRNSSKELSRVLISHSRMIISHSMPGFDVTMVKIYAHLVGQPTISITVSQPTW
jgi:hypothetical protein